MLGPSPAAEGRGWSEALPERGWPLRGFETLW